MSLVDDPDERFGYPPAACRGCGAGLAGRGGDRAAPPPGHRHRAGAPPKVTEHVAQAKACPCCGMVSEGALPRTCGRGPATAPRRTRRPRTWRRAPSSRSRAVGAAVPARRHHGLHRVAGRGPREGRRPDRGQRVRRPGAGPAAAAAAVHADETPARAAGGLRYVHLACTAYLTLMHTGDRSADAIDAGGVLPGYDGILVRDGYNGYTHLTSALHAWCGAHLLRDLKDVHDSEPGCRTGPQDGRPAPRGPRRRGAPPAGREGRARPRRPGLPGHQLPGHRRAGHHRASTAAPPPPAPPARSPAASRPSRT